MDKPKKDIKINNEVRNCKSGEIPAKKYTDDMPQSLIDYFSDREPYLEFEQSDSEGNPTGLKRVANPFPKLVDWAKSVNIGRTTIAKWVKEYPEFAKAKKFADEVQENYCMTNGLLGLCPGDFTKFVMKNKFNWKDTVTTDDITEKSSVSPENIAEIEKRIGLI